MRDQNLRIVVHPWIVASSLALFSLATSAGCGGKLPANVSPDLAVAASLRADLDGGVGSGSGSEEGGASPYARATGAELGIHASLGKKLKLSLAGWYLGLTSELVWSGDTGTTEVNGATVRGGGEFEARYQFADWIWEHSLLRC